MLAEATFSQPRRLIRHHARNFLWPAVAILATVLMELGQSGGPTPTHLIRAQEWARGHERESYRGRNGRSKQASASGDREQ